jgi:hypothetical protein
VKKLVFLIVMLVALASAALALAATRHGVNAHLTVRVEVPKPVGTKKAAGAFSGSYVVHAKDLELKWKLSFTHLTGRATAATLREGKPGLIGEQITILCKPCKTGKGATTLLRKSVVQALRAGHAYVVVHTSRNPAGEIRGQIRVKG